MSLYLAPKDNYFLEQPNLYGGIINVFDGVNGWFNALDQGMKFMLDCSQYKDRWTWKRWMIALNKLLPYADNCLGIVIPDKLADYVMTLHYFKVYAEIPKKMGFRVALVTQDRLIPDLVPWDKIDTLFIGGSDNHKRGNEGFDLATEAIKRGKWLHIGRVNSSKMIYQYYPFADSFDGTTFVYHPTQQLESITKCLISAIDLSFHPRLY